MQVPRTCHASPPRSALAGGCVRAGGGGITWASEAPTEMTSSESPGELAEPQPEPPELPMEKRVTISSSLSTPRTSQKLDWPQAKVS
jgi:hypothetical protein